MKLTATERKHYSAMRKHIQQALLAEEAVQKRMLVEQAHGEHVWLQASIEWRRATRKKLHVPRKEWKQKEEPYRWDLKR